DPPTLLANSTDYKVGCEIVNPTQAEEMATDLQNVGVAVQLDLNDKCAHALGYSATELGPTTTFLESHLFVPPVIVSAAGTRGFRVGSASSFTVKSKA